ncbi:MAG: flavodoxin family protein [Novosphingobium sp.]
MTVAIIWHSRTGASQAMAQAVADGAGELARLVPVGHADADLLASAGALIFVCPENLGTMSGAMKEMFDRNYYPLLGRIEGKPYASAIAAGSAGQGAEAKIDHIASGWRLRRVAESLIVNLAAQTPESILESKVVPKHDLARCRELGQAIAEGISLGIF